MYIDHKFFFEAVQEVATPLNGARANKGHYRPNGVNGQYKLIWSCAQLLFDKLIGKKEEFQILEMNRSCYRKKLCDWIYNGSRRNLMKRSDLTEESHPHVWEYVKDLSPSALLYYLDQTYVFEKAVSAWGITVSEGFGKAVACDLCRIIGIMVSEKFRNVVDGAERRVIVVDDVEDTVEDHQNRYYFEVLTTQFNDVKTVVAHPDKWISECSDLVGYNDIDPNDFKRIKLHRRGEELKSLWLQVYQQYKSAMHVWRNGLGKMIAGNENVENYGEGEERRFDQVARAHQVIKDTPYLTWVHLADKNAGFPLYSRYENKSSTKVSAVSTLYYAKYDGAPENRLKIKRVHSEIVKDVALSQKCLERAKNVYKEKKKKRRTNATKIGEIQLAKEAVKIYMVNLDLLTMELAQSIGPEMMSAVQNFDVSSDSDSCST